ncbi:cyclic nucleotide-binding/CBS domain-containing protein [Streptomyces sp. NPDC048566]|uniref:CBS domain-containing protein n=1 Tax=Streptomyces sp. NPDC048566 TaxID=3365569 RepID=UPI003712DCAB
MKVSEVMTAPGVRVGPGASLSEAARVMARAGVGSLLVVEDGTLRGIVTDRDLALRGLGESLPAGAPVSAVMSAEVATVDAGDDLDAAYRTFRRRGFRRLPVLRGGEPVGVLTVDDLFLDVLGRLGALLGPVAQSILHDPEPVPGPGQPAATPSAPAADPGPERAAGPAEHARAGEAPGRGTPR